MSEKQKLRPIVQSETSGQMVNILCSVRSNNFVKTVDIESVVDISVSEKQKLRPIVQSDTSGQMINILCFRNNFVKTVDIEPWSHIPCRRHPMSSYWRVFQCGDVKEAKC